MPYSISRTRERILWITFVNILHRVCAWYRHVRLFSYGSGAAFCLYILNYFIGIPRGMTHMACVTVIFFPAGFYARNSTIVDKSKTRCNSLNSFFYLRVFFSSFRHPPPPRVFCRSVRSHPPLPHYTRTHPTTIIRHVIFRTDRLYDETTTVPPVNGPRTRPSAEPDVPGTKRSGTCCCGPRVHVYWFYWLSAVAWQMKRSTRGLRDNHFSSANVKNHGRLFPRTRALRTPEFPFYPAKRRINK